MIIGTEAIDVKVEEAASWVLVLIAMQVAIENLLMLLFLA